MKKVPYVISEDIRSMSRFGDYRLKDVVARYISQSIVLHCEKFVSKNIIMLDEKELTEWVTRIAPPDVVIQTIAYSEKIASSFVLQVTRAIDENFNKIPNQMPRQGYASIQTQLVNLGLFTEHTLLDDVIFTGQGCKEIIELSLSNNVIIKKVISCVSTREGKKLLESMGVRVESLHYFDTVTDEVCQRDFIPGLPYAGRTLVTNNGDYRYVPYLLPWGNPMDWASVPKKNAVNFSKACIATAIEFWEEVYPSIRFFEVPAIIYDPKVESTKLRFVDYLHQSSKAL